MSFRAKSLLRLSYNGQHRTQWALVRSIKNCTPNEQVIAGLWALAITLHNCNRKVMYTLSVVDLLIPALLLSVLNSVSLWDLQNQWQVQKMKEGVKHDLKKYKYVRQKGDHYCWKDTQIHLVTGSSQVQHFPLLGS